MAYEEVIALDADVTVSLGGVNRKTGKKNPTQVEGYYLGKREVEDKKSRSGVSYIYYFQTANGNVGVWGKTDLNKKMASAVAGAMTRATCTGQRETPNGPMYTYKLEVDRTNIITVPNGLSASTEETTRSSGYNDGGDEDSLYTAATLLDDGSGLSADEEDASQDEALAAAELAAQAAAARKAKVQALLSKKK